MKLASLKHGRDGHLVVVSRDLKTAVDAGEIAPTMQSALDNWEVTEPLLQTLYERLNNGEGDYFTFVPEVCASPLPRALSMARRLRLYQSCGTGTQSAQR